ncbi:circularly permuted type 2 ATP-grasp protein [Saccharospirillum impatiens]|uniref:circularly permuted type 2 ATP-grasp protein n=1 Tax=Saccharospirillum impatiens TaxID=169438 RepID=UPI000411FB66|nr:circularly permuted type 2 ATP-grasp protein [Saccharospirillum impatiens]
MRNPAQPSPLLNQLLTDYQAARPQGTHQYDDLVTREGQFRARWQPLVEELDELGLDGLQQRTLEAQNLLYENGVTFNVYEDDVRKMRSWQLDPIPYVISPQSWTMLEQGLKQRARLLECLVADLYGERRVLSDGILPPELVYTHPGWLFPAADSGNLYERPRVIFQGMDVMRNEQGEWRVLGDWTQAASGVGYSLENRIILSRALSRLYRDAPLSRLAGFLQAYHRCLSELAPHRRENPNIVLFTPGPGSSGYFEHAWLANYMNFSLVEGGDLVVRDGQVSMRTLGGLKAVDVIVRQVTDPWCDPLELRGDSLLGVPGLLQAARRGEVAIANSLGVGVLEHPALAAFLPGLCQYLLGEPLQLAGRDVLWCGAPGYMNTVLEDLNAWQIRAVNDVSQTISPGTLTPEAQASLRQSILQAPHLYVAEQPLKPASSPSYNLKDNKVTPQPVCLRFFALADPGEGNAGPDIRQHRIMPGGLAWVADPGTPVMESAIVKDIWVLSPVAQPHVSLLQRAKGPILVTRDGMDLPSRVAESLFWIGRYGERLDNRSRLMRESLTSLIEEGQLRLVDTLLPDLFTALKLELPESLAPDTDPADTIAGEQPAAVEQFMCLRKSLLGLFQNTEEEALPSMFHAMLRNSRAVRDHLGDDAWRTINTLHQTFSDLPGTQGANAGQRKLEDIITLLAAFFGLCNETMPHHYGWRFMDIGRITERCIASLELLKLAMISASRPGTDLWETVLATTDNLTVYRRRYRSQLYPAAILDLLLFDETNPRSVGYMLKRLETQIEHLPRPETTPFRSQETRLIIQATSHLHLVDLDSLTDLENSTKAQAALENLLDQLLTPLYALSDAVSHSHFSHAETPKQLVTLQGSDS